MNKKQSFHTGFVCLIAVVFTILVLQVGCDTGGEKAVRIAANLPMTGDFAIWGASVRDGAIMALEDIEKSDPKGPRLNVDWQDNAGDPKAAVSIMQKQYLQPPAIYISGIKPQSMAIKAQIEEKGTPHFVWIFDAFINKNSRNNLRTLINYKIEPPVYLEYAKARNPKRVAIIYVYLPHSHEEFTQLVIPPLKDMGAEVYAESYDIGLKDYKDIAVKVKDFNPDLIILNGFQHTLVGIVRALRPLGLITDGNTIGTYDMIDAAEVLGKDEIEGIRAVAPLFETRPEQEKVVKWKERFRDRFGSEPLYIHAFAYDMMMVIHDAAKRLKLPATSEQWIEALRATKIEGITGPLSFDEDGDIATPLEIGVFRNGKLIPDETVSLGR
ncbi:MAG: ABC transporter substrate-binding protein [Candidatus Poribacteria bacterium]